MHAPRYYTRLAAREYRELQEEKAELELVSAERAIQMAAIDADLERLARMAEANQEFLEAYVRELQTRFRDSAEANNQLAQIAGAYDALH